MKIFRSMQAVLLAGVIMSFNGLAFAQGSGGNYTFRASKPAYQNIMAKDDYEAGNAYRGIWGLYGGYDYISPHIFRVSSTSVSLGTTFQWWLSQAVALQGSALGGVGYAAAGNVAQVGERDYHYGVAPQGLLSLRLILGDRAMLDLTGRAYYLTGMGGEDPGEKRISNA